MLRDEIDYAAEAQRQASILCIGLIMEDWLAIILFVGIPLLLPLLGLWWLSRRHKNSDSSLGFYHFNVGGSRIVISKKALITLGLWIIPILWLDNFLPFFSLPLLIALVLLFILRRYNYTTVELGKHSSDVLGSLQKMQTQISEAKSHIEQLASEVQVRQVEIEEQEKLRTSLRQEIENRLKEVEAWKSLTEEQKNLFIQATKEAINKRTAIQMLSVVLGSIALNLAASVIWALMGSPGQEQLMKAFQSFRRLFSGAG